MQLFSARRVEDAVTALEEATRLDPTSVEAFYWLGRCRVVRSKQASYSRATDAFQEALRLDPAHVEAHWGLGLSGFLTASYEQSELHFREFLRRADDVDRIDERMLAEANHFVGTILVFDRRCEEALPFLREAERLHPEFADTPFQYGVAMEDLGRYPEAIEALLRATRIDPDHLPAHFRLSRVYQRLGDEDNARREREIHRLLNELTDNISLKASQDLRTQMRLLSELTALYPENHKARLRHAQLLVQNNRAADGDLVLDALLRDHPEQVEPYLYRAELQRRLRNPTMVQSVLSSLLANHPELPRDTIPAPLQPFLPPP